MAYYIDENYIAHQSEIGITRDNYGQIILKFAGEEGFLIISEKELLSLSDYIKEIVYGYKDE